MATLTTCLWFDDQAEEAARFYTSIFSNSKILQITHYGREGFEIHGRPEGSVMTVSFELEGSRFTALNGGPVFKLSPAVSLEVQCDSQGEIDYYWERLSEGGDAEAQQCGWLQDRFGLSWQIVPRILNEWICDEDPRRADLVMKELLSMKKLDIERLRSAYESE
jgi:predicted 3-demethylubiquinone-9 3-methyltransferase (glyoxalase superfamily)